MKRHQQQKSSSSVGVEITPTALYAVEIRAQRRELVIQRLAQGEVPEGSVHNGRVVDPTAVASALRQLWEKGGFSVRHCTVAVPGGALTPQILTLPPAPPEEQRLIVRNELARFAQIEDDDSFGWIPLAPGSGRGGNSLAFLVERNLIAGYRQVFTLGGLQVDACEPDALAALRALALGVLQEESAAVVYASAPCFNIAFLEAGQVSYYRRLEQGSGELTDIATAGLRSGEHDSDDSVLSRCLESQEITPPPCHARGEELGPLLLEVKRSLQYYARAYSASPQPKKILLLGDYPLLAQLAQAVREEVRLEAECLDPLSHYPQAPRIRDESSTSSRGRYSVALGLALRPFADAASGLTLDLETHDRTQTLARHASRCLTVSLSGSVFLALVVLGVSSLLNLRLSQVHSDLNQAQAELLAVSTERTASMARMQQARRETHRLRKQALPVPWLLTYLGAIVPDALGITSLELKADGSMTMEGDARAPQQVNSLLQRLSYDPTFRSPSLDTLDSNGEHGTVRFRVHTGLVGYRTQPKKDGARGQSGA